MLVTFCKKTSVTSKNYFHKTYNQYEKYEC